MIHIVEYEPEVLNLLRDFFAASRLGVLTFDSSISYLEYVNSTEFVAPAALIVALDMPRVDGQSLAARVRKKYPQLKVVLTSGFPDYEMTPEVMQSICAYLHKPFRFGRLVTLLSVLHTCHKEPGQGSPDIFRSVCQFGKSPHCPHYPDAARG